MKIILSLFIILILCSACSTMETKDITETQGTMETPESYRKLTDNVFINFDVTYPRETHSLYTAVYNTYTPQFLADIFLANDESEQRIKLSDWDPNGFRLTTAMGNYIDNEDGDIRYHSPDYDTDKEILDIMKQYSQTKSLINDVTFSFMSRDEAVEISTALLEKMGMFGESEIHTFVAMPHDEIVEYQEKLMEDEGYASFVDIGKTTILNNLTDKDDAYFIRFAFKYNGTNFFDRENEQPIESAIEGAPPISTYAEILITKEGIKIFSLSGSLSASGKTSDPQNLISIDELLEAVINKYELQIITEPTVFTRAYMEYLPIPANANFNAGEKQILTPYWCLECSDIQPDGTLRTYGAERFNAITGEDFAYGG